MYMWSIVALSSELEQQSIGRTCSLAREDKFRLDQKPKCFPIGITQGSSRLQWKLPQFNNHVMAITLTVNLGYAWDSKGDLSLTV